MKQSQGIVSSYRPIIPWVSRRGTKWKRIFLSGCRNICKIKQEWMMLLNCGVGEDSRESLGLQGDPTSPFWRRSTLGFLWKNDAKAEAPVLWPPHAKSWLIGKDLDAGKDWRQEMTEDETVGRHHQLDGHEFEQALGVCDGQGCLARYSPWGLRVKHDWVTELNLTEEEVHPKMPLFAMALLSIHFTSLLV